MRSQSSAPVEMTANRGGSKQEKIQGIAIGSLALAYILTQFFSLPQLEVWVSVIILTLIVWILPSIRGSILWICLVLLVTGGSLMLYHHVPLVEWANALRVNLTLVSVFLLVPLLGIPVRTGGYVAALKVVLFRKLNDPNLFFLGTTMLTHILGVVLNIGAISIVYELTKASQMPNPRLVANAINRGFVTALYWSPYFSAMALILSQFPNIWSSIVGYALALVLVSFGVSYAIEWPLLRSVPRVQGEATKEVDDEQELEKAKRKVCELFVLLLLMVSVVLLLEVITPYPMVLIICVISILFPLVWCFLCGKGAAYREECKRHLYAGIPRMKKEMILFLIAGFFSGAFVHAEISQYLIEAIHAVFGSFTMGIAFFIALLVVLSAVVGVHPIVLVTILITGIEPEWIGVSPAYYCLLVLASWGISNTVAPTAAANNLLANLTKVNVSEVSIKWNIKFAVMMLILIPIFLEVSDL